MFEGEEGAEAFSEGFAFGCQSLSKSEDGVVGGHDVASMSMYVAKESQGDGSMFAYEDQNLIRSRGSFNLQPTPTCR